LDAAAGRGGSKVNLRERLKWQLQWKKRQPVNQLHQRRMLGIETEIRVLPIHEQPAYQ
jgi:hypothetical protein